MATAVIRAESENATSSGTRPQRHLSTLLHISRAIGTILDSQKLMTSIMRHVTEAFEAERSTLYLHDPARRELWTRVAQGLETWTAELRIVDDAGICGHVFQSQQSLRIVDALSDLHFARGVADRVGYLPRSMLVVPVVLRGGRCDGVLQVLDRRVGYFTEQDLLLLEAIAVQVGISLDNARLYEAQQRQFDSFVRAFSAALDARDPMTARHSVNVANYAMGIADKLGLSPADKEWLRVAGLLHDIGKIGVPEAILTKPGKLTDDEFELMKRHAAYSRQILSKIEFIDSLRGMDAVAAAHHERLDGSGYPDGLSGDQIPLKARILCVADVYDALTQTRHYRAGMSMAEALALVDGMTPGELDADCVAALKAFLGWDGPSDRIEDGAAPRRLAHDLLQSDLNAR